MPKGLYRDSGLSNFLLFILSLDQLRASPLVGWLWEAVIIEEILKGCAVKSLVNEPYFYRTSDGREVDLVLDGAFGLLPIEIKYGMTVSDNDLRPLRTFMREQKLKLGIVISNIGAPRKISDEIIELPARLV
jgi:hypothetical protein